MFLTSGKCFEKKYNASVEELVAEFEPMELAFLGCNLPAEEWDPRITIALCETHDAMAIAWACINWCDFRFSEKLIDMVIYYTIYRR